MALAGLAVLVPAPPPVYDFEAAAVRANQAPSTTATLVAQAASTPTSATADRTVAVGVYGGSTGVILGAAVWDWAGNTPGLRAVPAWSHYGSGFITEGERVFARAVDGSPLRGRPDPECVDWQGHWLAATRDHHVQVAVVVTGVWETSDWVLDGRDTVSTIEDGDFDVLLRVRLNETLDNLNAGANVVLATAPQIGPGADGNARDARGLPELHGARVARYNQLRRDAALTRDKVTVIDYGAYIDSFRPEQSALWLPDGIHPTDEAARHILTEYLGLAVQTSIADGWPDLGQHPGSP